MLRSTVAIAVVVAVGLVAAQKLSRGAFTDAWTLLRSGLLVTMWLVYSASLPHLSLGVAAAAYYTSPIIITVLSASVANEPVGARRWGAVVVGFVGMLLILQPGAEGFTLFALLPFLAAVLYALAALTNTKCGGMAPADLSLNVHLGFLLVGGSRRRRAQFVKVDETSGC